MDKNREEEVLEKFLELNDTKLALLIVNFYKDITGIRKEMVGSLNLLDKVYEGDENSKELLRKNILDGYNELPRETLDFLEKLLQNLKE